MSSFSNRVGGGVIIFGLDEERNFEIVGVYDTNDLQKQVINQCNEMEPKIRPEFTIVRYGDLSVAAAEIPEVLHEQKPCYYKARGIEKGSYIRVGDADEPMSSYEIYNLTAYKKRIEEDRREVTQATLEDLDTDILKKYLDFMKEEKPNLAKFEDKAILSRLGVIKEVDNEYKPTIAGLLCFGICPDLILSQLVITATVIPGFEVGETGDLGERFVDNKKITGTIPEMIKAAVEFVTRNMKKRTIIRDDTGQRDDKLEYPITAIREGIINSLVHRDYSIHTEAQYVSIRMFNDRLEITNPGGLYGDLTVERIFDVVNPPVRNKNLIRILEEIGELENRSSGIATMVKEMRNLRLEPPEFKDERGVFAVTFKNHNLMTKEDQLWLKQLNTNLTENEAYALVYLKRNLKITNGDYQKINNVNRDKALFELKGLISKKLIKSVGVGSGTYYTLLDDNSNEVEFIEITDQGDEIMTRISDQDNGIMTKISEQEILDYCKTSKSMQEMLEHFGFKHKTYFRNKYLNHLLGVGKIKMTIPDKPTSKNQKYYSEKI